MLVRSDNKHHIRNPAELSNFNNWLLLQLFGQYNDKVHFSKNVEYSLETPNGTKIVTLAFDLIKRNKKNPKCVNFTYEIADKQLGEGSEGNVFSSKGTLSIRFLNNKVTVYYKQKNTRIIKTAKNPNSIFVINSDTARHSLEQEYLMMHCLKEIYKPKPTSKNKSMMALVSNKFEGVPLSSIFLSDVKNIVLVYINILNQLKMLRQNRMVHRDIKPENILIDPDTLSAFIIDFGYAIQTSTTPIDDKSSSPGTMEYASPEAFFNKTKVGTHSDIFSIGRMLLFTFSNKFSEYKGKDTNTMLELDKTLLTSTEWLKIKSDYPHFENDIKQLLQTMLAHNVSERASIDSALSDLKKIQSNIENYEFYLKTHRFFDMFHNISYIEILQIALLLSLMYFAKHIVGEKNHSSECLMGVMFIEISAIMLNFLSTYINVTLNVNGIFKNKHRHTIVDAVGINQDLSANHAISHQAPVIF